MTQTEVAAERLARQGLSRPATTKAEYIGLFKQLQPVSTPAFAYPGSPPRLKYRAVFDPDPLNQDLRADRIIVKGRFLDGTIGYVHSDDLSMYANAFRRPMDRMKPAQQRVLDAVTNTGPLTPRQIKGETDLLNKQIMPIMHRLQKAFLVYEDQVDTDWERAWYGFASEWPEIDLSEEKTLGDLILVLSRFIYSNAFTTFEHIKDWTGLPKRALENAIEEMEGSGMIVRDGLESIGEGWMLSDVTTADGSSPKPSVFMLDQGDPLTRAHKTELKRRYTGIEVLRYLLIDGEFRGAVCGHWRIGPHDVDDIILEMGITQRSARKAEIIRVVSESYQPPHHRIKRYDGREL